MEYQQEFLFSQEADSKHASNVPGHATNSQAPPAPVPMQTN